MNKILKFIVAVLVCQGAGLVGSLFTSPSISGWYATLQKPSFNPADWIFAPVWTLLFLLMGIALFLVWSRGTGDKKLRIAVLVFALQLLLNIFWSVLFFGLHSPLLAFLEITALWLAIWLTITTFFKISKLASYLLLPYLFWVSFAVVLNFSIMILN